MKKIILPAVAFALLIGCAYTDINRVQDKWGPPAQAIKTGDQVKYVWFLPEDSDTRAWVTHEFICDSQGKIISRRSYVTQPTLYGTTRLPQASRDVEIKALRSGLRPEQLGIFWEVASDAPKEGSLDDRIKWVVSTVKGNSWKGTWTSEKDKSSGDVILVLEHVEKKNITGRAIVSYPNQADFSIPFAGEQSLKSGRYQVSGRRMFQEVVSILDSVMEMDEEKGGLSGSYRLRGEFRGRHFEDQGNFLLNKCNF